MMSMMITMMVIIILVKETAHVDWVCICHLREAMLPIRLLPPGLDNLTAVLSGNRQPLRLAHLVLSKQPLRKILERFELVFLDSHIGNVGGLTQRGRPSLAQPYTSLLGLVVPYTLRRLPYIPESLEPCQAANWACYVGQRCSYMGHQPGGQMGAWQGM